MLIAKLQTRDPKRMMYISPIIYPKIKINPK
jgi:hypothetical protein